MFECIMAGSCYISVKMVIVWFFCWNVGRFFLYRVKMKKLQMRWWSRVEVNPWNVRRDLELCRAVVATLFRSVICSPVPANPYRSIGYWSCPRCKGHQPSACALIIRAPTSFSIRSAVVDASSLLYFLSIVF